jgi:hypothetical protein
MADEATTTSADDYVFASWKATQNILPNFYGLNVFGGLVRLASLAEIPSKAHDFPIDPNLSASGLTEGTDMANSAYTTTKATVTAAEVGIRTEPTDVLQASSILMGGTSGHMAQEMGKAMAAKRSTDIAALFEGFTGNAVTDTGNDIVEADVLLAITNLMADGIPGPYRGALHPETWRQLTADIGTTLTPAGYGDGARAESNDLAQPLDGFGGKLYGVDWVVSSLCPTANAGADRAGVILNPNYAIGLAEKWPVRVEFERNASLRSTEINVTAMYGVGELIDNAGAGLVFDA